MTEHAVVIVGGGPTGLRRRFAAMMSGLDIHYDLGKGHSLDARPVLLNLGESGGFDITPWAERVQLVDARYLGVWELPVLGAVPAPNAVLIRPDGYVAWVGDLAQAGLVDVLTTWFGRGSTMEKS